VGKKRKEGKEDKTIGIGMRIFLVEKAPFGVQT
jgi:hypothetical protein